MLKRKKKTRGKFGPVCYIKMQDPSINFKVKLERWWEAAQFNTQLAMNITTSKTGV